MTKILVTGGAGFVGSHLCERLLNGGHTVVCVDDLSTGQFSNIQPLVNNPNFICIPHDIRDLTPKELILEEIDQIYNLACPASPIHYQNDPIKTFETNVFGAVTMLNIALMFNARILQASTSEVYGDPSIHPQPESYWGNVNPIGMRSCYDEGKRGAETLFFDYHREKGVDIRVARIFNTYGPRMAKDDGRVVSNFIVQALNGEPLTVYGNGKQTRSFCYVDDLVDGLIRLMESDITGPVNLGNPQERTILGLAEMVIEMTGSKSNLLCKPLPKDDPVRRKPDIGLAERALGWRPRTILYEGLSRTILYFKEEMGC